MKTKHYSLINWKELEMCLSVLNVCLIGSVKILWSLSVVIISQKNICKGRLYLDGGPGGEAR